MPVFNAFFFGTLNVRLNVKWYGLMRKYFHCFPRWRDGWTGDRPVRYWLKVWLVLLLQNEKQSCKTLIYSNEARTQSWIEVMKAGSKDCKPIIVGGMMERAKERVIRELMKKNWWNVELFVQHPKKFPKKLKIIWINQSHTRPHL